MPMSENAIRALFATRLKDATQSDSDYEHLRALPVAWDDLPRPEASDDGPWIRANLRIYDRYVNGVGPNAPIIFEGAYVIGVFTPLGQGDGPGADIREDLDNLFQYKVLKDDDVDGRVQTWAAVPTFVDSGDGAWHHTNHRVQFTSLN